MKDHEIAMLVNDLHDIAVQFHGAQLRRERIAHVVADPLKVAQKLEQELIAKQREAYEDALHHAAFYVHDHCQNGEEHARVIENLKIPSKYSAKGAA